MAEEDIIFGKNRHFFGGIEPSNMQLFTASINTSTGAVTLKLKCPNDTIVNGRMLCTVGGIVIRRRTDHYPVDEFDGELVCDLKDTSIETYVDNITIPNGTYFYAAFPYSMQGVYNRNTANRTSVNEPSSLVTFKAYSQYNSTTDTVAVKITTELPEGMAGVIIRKSTIDFPANETEGELVADITVASNEFLDTNVTLDTTYFYSAFVYSSTGTYNQNGLDRITATARKCEYFYGYDIDLSDSDPDTRVSYPSDVDNAEFAPAYMDYTADSFNYGGWTLSPGEHFMPKPCILKYDGTVDYYLDPNDYSKREDGVTASDVKTLSYAGNAMMEWSKIYTKRWEENGIYKFRCSDTKLGDDWDCWCNYDKNDNEIDHFYTAIYSGFLNNSLLHSVSDQNSSGGLTIARDDHIALATGIGDGWHTEVYADLLLIQDLLVLMGKSTNTQVAFGTGNISGNVTVKSGTLDSKGMFFGSNAANSAVKVFGMENLWGNMFHGVSGLYAKIYTKPGSTAIKYLDLLYKITRGSHDGTSGDYNSSGDGYLTSWAGEQLTIWPPATTTAACEWVFAVLETSDYGRVVGYAGVDSRLIGSATTYECDSADMYGDSTGMHPAVFGGYSGYNYNCGIFSVYFYNSAAANCNIRISCKPILKEGV